LSTLKNLAAFPSIVSKSNVNALLPGPSKFFPPQLSQVYFKLFLIKLFYQKILSVVNFPAPCAALYIFSPNSSKG